MKFRADRSGLKLPAPKTGGRYETLIHGFVAAAPLRAFRNGSGMFVAQLKWIDLPLTFCPSTSFNSRR